MNLSSILGNTNASGGNIPTDVYNKVSKILADRNTAAPRINAALSADKTTLSGLGQLQSTLASLQNVAQSLSGVGVALSANASDKSVLNASTSSRSLAGSYSILVNQLAQSQTLRSGTLKSADAALGDGTPLRLNFDFGSVGANTFTTGSAVKSAGSVTIPAGADNLNGIAAAINGAKIGVTAKVVSAEGGYALELTGPSGAGGSMRIAASGNTKLIGLLAYNPTGAKAMSETAAARNAQLSINGVAMDSPSNTVSNALPGTTLKLTATGSTRLDIAQGSSQTAQNVTNLVNAYNTLNSKLATLRQGELKNDSATAALQGRLARVLGSGASLQALAAIGISVQKNGDLSIDQGKLKAATESNATAVGQLFSNAGKGIADNLASLAQGYIGPNGALPRRTEQINQDIAKLTNQKAGLEKSLTAQAKALVSYYSQQSGTTATGNNLASLLDGVKGNSNLKTSAFDWIA